MAKYVTTAGEQHEVPLGIEDLHAAKAANLTLPQYLNRKHADADPKLGTAFQQLAASEGLAAPGKNPFGIKPANIADLINGATTSAAVNTQQYGSPFGSASRLMFPNAVIEMVEDTLVKDYTTDAGIWDGMVKDLGINGSTFEQLVVSMNNPQGANTARAQRIAQNAEPSVLMQVSTADKIRRLGVWSIGLEMSDQAMKAGTIDQVAMILARQFAVERDARVYDQISSIWAGDNDMNVGAVSVVASSTLDGASTTLANFTHKAWVKFLARNRKYRRVTHVIADIDTYLAVEGRLGRPGTNNYDPSLARIDPQANVTNNTFGGNVQWMIVDSAANGGPVPANTLWAVDASRMPIVRVKDLTAEYSAQEAFVLRRSTAMRFDWSEAVYRASGDSELRAFDAMSLA